MLFPLEYIFLKNTLSHCLTARANGFNFLCTALAREKNAISLADYCGLLRLSLCKNIEQSCCFVQLLEIDILQ